jgi:N-acetylglutamate synthase-like GNAT family acetyltransferase
MPTKVSSVAEQVAAMIEYEAERSKMLAKTIGEIIAVMKSRRAIVIEAKGQVIAFAAVYEWKHYAEIGSVVTHPEHRKKGHGLEAINRSMAFAYSLHKPIIALANEASSRLFEKVGFKPGDKRTAHSELWAPCPTECLEYAKWPDCHCQLMIRPEECGGGCRGCW